LQNVTRDTQYETVTIAGKFCESGDILIRDIELPRLNPGDLLAIPMAGAYTLAMSSNYNLARRPAVVLVNQGEARLIQRRETFGALLARDLPLHRSASGAEAPFSKYQALGNDYIVLDPQEWPEPPRPEQIRRICDRRLGVGADGILWGPICRSAPFGVRLFNPDGGEFEKSGNGLRIFARYLWDQRLPASPDFAIDTPGGRVTAHVLDAAGSRIAMDMGRLSFDTGEIGLTGPARTVIEESVEVDGVPLRITAVTIGNPHCVVFSDGQRPEVAADLTDPSAELAQRVGPKLEHLSLYPNRTNVQFAQAIARHTLRIEIWERGAGYTLASGTSSCAAAGAAIRTGRCASPITVQMPGGTMLVEVDADWTARLTGTVDFVCSGELGSSLLRDS
jgi:diaminopimelate epimerase